MESNQPGRRDGRILCAILALALLLRLIGLNAPLWFDEVATVVEFVRLGAFQLMADYSSLNNHLFYSLQAKASFALFGEHPWSLRLPAVVFGLAGIAATWHLARSLFGAAQAHATALLIALSYHHVWFSQNGRAYTGLMFWWVLATMIFVSGIRRPALRTWLLYALVAAGAMYTHLTAGFCFAVHGLIYCALLLGSRLGERVPASCRLHGAGRTQLLPVLGFLLSAILSLAVYSPALPAVLDQVGAVSGTSEADVMQEYQNPLWTLLEVVRTLPGPTWASGTAVVSAALLMLLGAWGIARKEPIVAVAGLLFIPVTFAILIAFSMRIWPRFFFADLGFLLLFIVHGVYLASGFLARTASRLAGRQLSPSLVFGAAVVTMAALSAAILSKNYRHPKQDLAGALAYIEEHRKPGSAVTAIGLAAYPYQAYFERDWVGVESPEDLRMAMNNAPETWAVVIFPGRTERDYPEIHEILGKKFAPPKVFPGTLGGGEVLVYSSNDQGGNSRE